MKKKVGKRSPLAVIVSALALALIVVFFITRGQNNPAGPQPGADVVNTAPRTSTPPRNVDTPRTNTPAKKVDSTVGKAINDVAPASGKPIKPGITSQYKGYTIGHCCTVDMQKWEAWSSAQKDAFISQYVK